MRIPPKVSRIAAPEPDRSPAVPAGFARPPAGGRDSDRPLRWALPAVAVHVGLALALGMAGRAMLAPAGDDQAVVTLAFVAPQGTQDGRTQGERPHGAGQAAASAAAPEEAGPEGMATMRDADPMLGGQSRADVSEPPEPLPEAITDTRERDEAEGAHAHQAASTAPEEQVPVSPPSGEAVRPETASAEAPSARDRSGPVADADAAADALPLPPPAPSRRVAALPRTSAAGRAAPVRGTGARASGGAAAPAPEANGAGDQGRPSAASAGVADGEWARGVLRWLQAHRTYPPDALARGEQGAALVRLTVARDGRVQAFTLVQGTGSPRLDAAVEALLSHAELPPFPASMPQAQATIQIPIRYRLTS